MDLKTFLSSPHYIGVRDLPNNPSPKYQKRLYIAQDNLSRTVKIGWSQGGRDLSKKGVKSDWTFLWSWTLPSPSYVEQRIKSQLKKFRIKNFRDTDITSPNEQYINIESTALILLARMNILATYYKLEYIKYDKRLESLAQKLDIDNVEELVLFDAKFRPDYDTSKITQNIPDNYEGVEVLDRRYVNTEPEYLVKLMDKDAILNDQQLDEDRRQALTTSTGKWKKDTHVIVYWDDERENPINRMKGIIEKSMQVELRNSGRKVAGYQIKWLENNTFQTDSGEKSIDPYAPLEWVELDEEWFETEFKYKDLAKPAIKLCWIKDKDLTGSNDRFDENTEKNRSLVSNFMKNKSVVVENGNKNSIAVVQEWNSWNEITVRDQLQVFRNVDEYKIKKLINLKSRIHINKLYDLMKLDIEEEIKTLEYDINDYEEEVEAHTVSVKRKNGGYEVLMEVNGKIMELKETSSFHKRIVDEYLDEDKAGEKQEEYMSSDEEDEMDNNTQASQFTSTRPPARRASGPPGPPPPGVQRVPINRRGPPPVNQRKKPKEDREESKDSEDELGELQQRNRRNPKRITRTTSVPT